MLLFRQTPSIHYRTSRAHPGLASSPYFINRYKQPLFVVSQSGQVARSWWKPYSACLLRRGPAPPASRWGPSELCGGEFPVVATGYGSRGAACTSSQDQRVHEASSFISCWQLTGSITMWAIWFPVRLRDFIWFTSLSSTWRSQIPAGFSAVDSGHL